MIASRSKPSFLRRGRAEDRVYKIRAPLNDEELVIVEAEAAALSLSVEDYFVMRALDAEGVKGHA